ncbi:VWA domain-containing protein, partial [bacterium]|nr:VWA domain-containing protein [bacterium]
MDFAGETNLFLPLTLVQSQSDKDFIINKIENVNVGDWTGTNIGGPMLDAYNELNSERGIDGNAKASILLTDGAHNTGTHPDGVIPYYKNKNWPVHTIGFGAGEEFDEELLIKIASETGGIYHHAPSTAELQDIYNSIGGTIRGEQVVSSTAGPIHPEQSVLEEVCIDPSVREASFTVNWEGSDVDLVLYRPDGTIVNELVASTDPDITFIEAPTYEVYNVNNPPSGKWTMH